MTTATTFMESWHRALDAFAAWGGLIVYGLFGLGGSYMGAALR